MTQGLITATKSKEVLHGQLVDINQVIIPCFLSVCSSRKFKLTLDTLLTNHCLAIPLDAVFQFTCISVEAIINQLFQLAFKVNHTITDYKPFKLFQQPIIQAQILCTIHSQYCSCGWEIQWEIKFDSLMFFTLTVNLIPININFLDTTYVCIYILLTAVILSN